MNFCFRNCFSESNNLERQFMLLDKGESLEFF